jgi:hypothetical protein
MAMGTSDMRFVLGLAAFAALAFAPMSVSAEPGLGGEVYGAGVTRGQTELELRYAYLNGGEADGEWNVVGEFAHAYTDWWRPAILIEADHEAGENSDLEAVAFENIFDFTGTRDWPVHFGGYVEYEFNTRGESDVLELKLLAERERGPLRLRFNAIGERALGGSDNNDWEYGYAAQAMYALNDDVRLGLEGYGDAGTDSDFGTDNHSHYWGPAAEFEAFESDKGELEINIGYLAGIDDAESDGQFRISLEWEH